MNRFLQVFIALLGLVITCLLGYANIQSDRLQTTNGLLAVYSESVSVARQTCDVGMLEVAWTAVDRLEEEKENKEIVESLKDNIADIGVSIERCNAEKLGAAYAGSVQNPETPETSAPGLDDQASEIGTLSDNVALRVELSKQADPEDSDSASGDVEYKYFAVLASYDTTARTTKDPVRGIIPHFLSLLEEVSGYDVEIYKTRISNHYAIVASPEGASGTTDAQAREIARVARRNGWASDAFMQENRNWIRCGAPRTVAELLDCG